MEPNEYLTKVICEYGREMENLWDKLPGGMFNPLESLALYGLIRQQKPRNLLEIGSLLGKSTSIIQQALEYNGTGILTSCDLEPRSVLTQRNVNKLYPDNKINFLQGPVESNIDKIGKLDFAFIDGPHSSEFMQWCIDNVVSRVEEGGLVLIHDINLSFNWNYRETPGCETECLMNLELQGKLPLRKFVWLEDWCLNHYLKDLRTVVFNDFPRVGGWGILNDPEMNSLSIWIKKGLNNEAEDKHSNGN